MTADLNHVVLIHGAWSRGQQLSDARRAFEERGYVVHTPTLRHHELSLEQGAARIGTLSLRDYVEDLSELVRSLPAPPLLVGHSLGGLIAQLVAARVAHSGVIAACPSPVGPAGTNATTLRIALEHRQSRPWTKPVYPPGWALFRTGIAHTHPEELVREAYEQLVCESGRIINFEVAFPWFDRARSARVDYSRISGRVLIIGAQHDRIVSPKSARRVATRYRRATYVEIEGADHMVFTGDLLSLTMQQIDKWLDVVSRD
jgi:pimeloyl-ACP methyl ester carboxylesterase